jgi:hypothetical protein
MSSGGFIKLYRDISDTPFWHKKPFDEGRAWIDLILLANYKDGKLLRNNKLIDIPRGTVPFSMGYLEDRWGWSNTKVKHFLSLLETENMVIVKQHQKNTAIDIVNYSIYQDVNTKKTPQKHHENTTETPPFILEEQKELKEEEKDIEKESPTSFGSLIKMKQSEYEELCNRFTASVVNDKIETMDNWLISKGKSYKDYYRALINWIKDDQKKEKYSAKEKRIVPSTFEHSDELKEVPWNVR